MKKIVYSKKKGWHQEGDISRKEMLSVIHRSINHGTDIYIKFTCQNCKSRQTSDTANVIHVTYSCEACGQITEPKAYGALAHFSPKATT